MFYHSELIIFFITIICYLNDYYLGQELQSAWITGAMAKEKCWVSPSASKECWKQCRVQGKLFNRVEVLPNHFKSSLPLLTALSPNHLGCPVTVLVLGWCRQLGLKLPWTKENFLAFKTIGMGCVSCDSYCNREFLPPQRTVGKGS